MWYAIYCRDNANSLALRHKLRPVHLARLEQLRRAGRLLLAGPFCAIDNEEPGDYGFRGSLIVAEFEDLAAAEDWAAEDPYKTKGVYQHVEVLPFKKVLP